MENMPILVFGLIVQSFIWASFLIRFTLFFTYDWMLVVHNLSPFAWLIASTACNVILGIIGSFPALKYVWIAGVFVVFFCEQFVSLKEDLVWQFADWLFITFFLTIIFLVPFFTKNPKFPFKGNVLSIVTTLASICSVILFGIGEIYVAHSWWSWPLWSILNYVVQFMGIFLFMKEYWAKNYFNSVIVMCSLALSIFFPVFVPIIN